MNLKGSHEILVAGESFAACEHKVLRFFKRNLLVRYDTVMIAATASLPAGDPAFWERVDRGLAANREVLQGLLAELAAEGFSSLGDLATMKQGFHSKTLHTASHLLDGFFGVDSFFYSYEDDSHWLAEATRKRIKAAPAAFWLLRVEGESSVGGDRFQSLRSAETGVTKED